MDSKATLFTLAGVALTAVLWWAFKPVPAAAPAAAPSPMALATVSAVAAADARAPLPTSADPPASVGERVFELTLKQGRLVAGPARLEAREGDYIVLEVASDIGDELHLHGYDLRARIAPDRAVRLAFIANRTGRFGLELHRAHADLGALEVYPR